MEKVRCYIVGAGEFDESTLPLSDDFVIAADGGFVYLHERGIEPDLIVGDFDSLPAEFMDAVNRHPNVTRVSAEKDDTDMLLAVKEGLKRGFKSFAINGCLGGKLDQTYANIQILTFITDNAATGVLYGNSSCVTAVTDSSLELNPSNSKGKAISIFSAEKQARGVTLSGLRYPLTDAVITNYYPGVSNEFTEELARMSVSNGTLIIIWEK